ncbi:unnamed protein product [Kluyveromyces dobzhanskii CBS 2104]|uniref:WGS project CCBQ000000000 data, contig 00058 n=1 Tax=Kluyveromyces dobzhanskii CBS 2104 TaxID=1427455 RepID=A0A0A8LDZ7_9SACH|nr:unnamed protein product [Kluyveromyces dobzhanskii CBS 2104]
MTVRRSNRIRSTKLSYNEDSEDESESESEVEHQTMKSVVTDGITHAKDSNQQGDAEDLLSDSSSSEEEDAANDDDYVAPGSKKRARSNVRLAANKKKSKPTRTSRSQQTNKNSSVSSRKENEAFLLLEKEFKPTDLFEILSSFNDFSFEELASDWLDSYSENRNIALSNLLNFLLDCAGCFTHIGEHDVANNNSSNETIGEIQIMFQEQKKHEFHLLLSSTQKKPKFGRLPGNFNSFMAALIELAIEKEMIYLENENEESNEVVIETNPLIVDLLTWIPSMSVSKIRSLRYVSSAALFSIQNTLSEASVTLEDDVLFKLRKQLTLESKRKKPKVKAIETLKSSISDAEATKTVIENTMDNIIKLCFVHRFKDVDENIRCMAISHLSDWIKNNPEYFFKVTFLKYFGWLLSDSHNSVRLQVVTSLHELIKFSNKRNKNTVDNAALRQFFERFKDRMLEIASRDVDLQVRLTSVQVLSSINAYGYLDDSEVVDIVSLIYYDHEVKVSASSKDVRFLNEVAKFATTIIDEKTRDLIENNEGIEISISTVTKEQLFRVGVLMRLLHNSLLRHMNSAENEEERVRYSKNKIKLLQQAANFLSPKFHSSSAAISKLLYEDINYENVLQHNGDGLSQDLLDVHLFLPNTDNNVVFYTTVLVGLCTGGMCYNKGQNRHAVTQMILPELNNLFDKMILDSDLIYTQLLSLIQLFNMEEWSSISSKDIIFKINTTVIKKFESSPAVLDDSNAVTEAYKKLIPYLMSLHISEISGSWKSCMVNILLSLSSFLECFDIQSEDSIATLYLQFFNKLTILGREFPIEISDSLLNDITKRFLRQLSDFITRTDSESLSLLNFKIFTSIVSWNLETWSGIIKNSHEQTTVSHSALHQVRTVIVELMKLSVEIDLNSKSSGMNKYHLLNLILSPLLDSIIAFKIFELNHAENLDWARAFKQDGSIDYDELLPSICHRVFLYLESCLGKSLEVNLDRESDEDVNFNDASVVRSTDSPEKDLCIFTLKLKGLMKLGLMNLSRLEDRIKLNEQKLGLLFSTVVNETIFSDELKNTKYRSQTPTAAEKASTQNYEEPLEPIEEFTQGEIVSSPQQPDDPIVSSPI